MASPHHEVDLISSSNFAFSNALHEQLRIHGEGGNLIYSPFSLGLVLLMARFGARGRTGQQLDRVLNPVAKNASLMLDDLVPLRRGFFRVLKSIQTDKTTDYNVTVANRMFTGIGFSVEEEFKKISKATLDIKVKQLDFNKDGGRRAAEVINSWVANRTNGKINEIISSNSLTNQTQVILVNTLHFKAPWEIPFELEGTRSATFHLNPNELIQASMMTSVGQYPYGDIQELNATAVVIPYKGRRFSMYVYVPKQKGRLDHLIHALKNSSMDQIRAQIQRPGNCEEVQLSLPRFNIQSELKLVEPLKKMGAEDMFSAALADFTGISTDGDVYVSDVVQKAFITVDEGGTEATATSSIRAGTTCFPSITEITVDRPFYFQIVDEKMSGLVLFAGTVHDPRGGIEVGKFLPSRTSSDEYENSMEDVNIRPEESGPMPLPTSAAAASETKIIFATSQGGIKMYSERTQNVETVVNSTANLRGVAWDSKHQQLYFCSVTEIFRVQLNGSNVQRLLSTSKYGNLTALAFDSVTGNLYGVTDKGIIFACKTTPLEESLRCASVLAEQGSLSGIALNPNEGTMYWTRSSDNRNGSIYKAHLDGSSRVMVRSGLIYPGNIVIDQDTSRLLWTDYSTREILSSDLFGGNVASVVALRSRLHKPWGIAVHDGKLFWGTLSAKMLQIATRSGKNIKIVHVGSDIGQLTIATADDQNSIAREHHCDGRKCAGGICALTPTSFRCISAEF